MGLLQLSNYLHQFDKAAEDHLFTTNVFRKQQWHTILQRAFFFCLILQYLVYCFIVIVFFLFGFFLGGGAVCGVDDSIK